MVITYRPVLPRLGSTFGMGERCLETFGMLLELTRSKLSEEHVGRNLLKIILSRIIMSLDNDDVLNSNGFLN